MELVKSKNMIIFVILLIGVFYIGTMNSAKLNEESEIIDNNQVAINM